MSICLFISKCRPIIYWSFLSQGQPSPPCLSCFPSRELGLAAVRLGASQIWAARSDGCTPFAWSLGPTYCGRLSGELFCLCLTLEVALDLGVEGSFAPSLEMPLVSRGCSILLRIFHSLPRLKPDKIFQRDFVLFCFFTFSSMGRSWPNCKVIFRACSELFFFFFFLCLLSQTKWNCIPRGKEKYSKDKLL